MRFLQVVIPSIVLFVAQGCGNGACSLKDEASLEITVVGGEGPSGTCEATVIVTTGGVSETVPCSVDRGDCNCTHGTERTGTFEIEATLDETQAVQTVVVELDESECHVVTQEVCFFGDCSD